MGLILKYLSKLKYYFHQNNVSSLKSKIYTIRIIKIAGLCLIPPRNFHFMVFFDTYLYILNSMHILMFFFSFFLKFTMDREASCAAIHGVAKS